MPEQGRIKTKPVRAALLDHAPWKPPRWEEEDAGALQALQRGSAMPHQQQRALKFIIETVCATYDMHYFDGEGGERNTAFALGRAFAGQQVVKLLKINLAKLGKRSSEHG